MIECLCYTSPQHGPSQKFSGTWVSFFFLFFLKKNQWIINFRSLINYDYYFFFFKQDGISKIIRYEGPLNLWRGLSATLYSFSFFYFFFFFFFFFFFCNHFLIIFLAKFNRVTAIPTTVIYFVGYEHLRDYLRQSLPKSRFNDYEPILAGSLARSN